MSVVPRLHAVHDDGDRTIYLCGVQDCYSETNHAGTTLVGWIERGRELATQYGTKVEFAFVPNHPTHPCGSVHLGNIAQAWQDARDFAGLVADHQLVVSSSA